MQGNMAAVDDTDGGNGLKVFFQLEKGPEILEAVWSTNTWEMKDRKIPNDLS